MQNLTEGQSVAYNGRVATVFEVYPFTVKLILEDGTEIVAARTTVQPRSFLTESN